MSGEIVKLSLENDLINSWFNALDLECQAGDISEATMKTYQVGLKRFYSQVSSEGVNQVDSKVIQKWKAELQKRGAKPNTVNTWLAGVRRFFGWATGEGFLIVNPALAVKGAKRKKAGKTHLRDNLTDREVRRVLAQPDRNTIQGKRDYCILSIKAYCALRDIEIHRADIEDISTVKGLPVLRVQGKGSSEKNEVAVIYHPSAQDAIYEWLAVRGKRPGALFISLSDRSRGGRLGLPAIRHLVMGYYRKAGIIDPRKTSHSLRHSAISKVCNKGGIIKAREVARHTNIQTTYNYFHEEDRLENPGEAFIDYGD